MGVVLMFCPGNGGEGEGGEAHVGCLHQQSQDQVAEVLAGGVRGCL